MPDCKRSLWNYNNSKMSHLKGEIDALSNAYLKKYHKKDYEELKEKLMKQDVLYREAYGESKSSYFDGKIEDLYTRLGNAILKEIREYDKNKIDMENLSKGENVNLVSSENDFINHEEKIEDVSSEYKEKEAGKKESKKGGTSHKQKTEEQNFEKRTEPLKEPTDTKEKYETVRLNNKWKQNSIHRRKSYNTQRAINGLKRALDNSYESYKNQREYERVLEEQRRERNSKREIPV